MMEQFNHVSDDNITVISLIAKVLDAMCSKSNNRRFFSKNHIFVMLTNDLSMSCLNFPSRKIFFDDSDVVS